MKALLASLLLFMSVPAFAQKPNEIRGKVTDQQTGERLGYTMTTLIRESDRAQRKVQSDSEGNYNIYGIIPGTYTLIVEYTSYKTLEINGIVIAEDTILQNDIQLKLYSWDPEEMEPVATPKEPN